MYSSTCKGRWDTFVHRVSALLLLREVWPVVFAHGSSACATFTADNMEGRTSLHITWGRFHTDCRDANCNGVLPQVHEGKVHTSPAVYQGQSASIASDRWSARGRNLRWHAGETWLGTSKTIRLQLVFAVELQSYCCVRKRFILAGVDVYSLECHGVVFSTRILI